MKKKRSFVRNDIRSVKLHKKSSGFYMNSFSWVTTSASKSQIYKFVLIFFKSFNRNDILLHTIYIEYFRFICLLNYLKMISLPSSYESFLLNPSKEASAKCPINPSIYQNCY